MNHREVYTREAAKVAKAFGTKDFQGRYRSPFNSRRRLAVRLFEANQRGHEPYRITRQQLRRKWQTAIVITRPHSWKEYRK